ncbi:MAG: ABC transporter ATP-binding protein [Bowdeniella nasicola]|nr:ABC transporter ATP-binding protein [Bowdeniella nasicola]
MITLIHQLLPTADHPRLRRYHIALAVEIMVRAVATVTLIPLLTALFSDTPQTAWRYLAALTVLTAGAWALEWKIGKMGYDLGWSLLEVSQEILAERLTRVPLAWLEGSNAATARKAIAATGPTLAGMFTYLYTPVVGAVFLPASIGLALLFIAWPLGVAALAGVAIVWGAHLGATRLAGRADRRAEQANTALGERLLEFARTQRELRSARRADAARSQAGKAARTHHTAQRGELLWRIPGRVLFDLATNIMLFVFAAITVWLVWSGVLNAAGAIALIVVLARYLEAFSALADLSVGLEKTRTSLNDIAAVIDAPVLCERETDVLDTPVSTPNRIELRHVHAGYDDHAVLTDLSVTFKPGTTAIVGPSGSGKTTLLHVLAGLLRPHRGAVMLDERELWELSTTQRRAVISVVFQRPYLFADSITANIAAGAQEATGEEIAAVARAARIEPIAAQLAEGMETNVGEGGTALSGGERQRVSIARALLKAAPILLIDEATSALDSENEVAIVQALENDASPIRIVVAHRLSTIAHAERVLFIDDGKIIEDGTPEQLRKSGGRFAEFWEHQRDAAAWQIKKESVSEKNW